MKQHRDLSLWLLTLITGSAAASVACVEDVDPPIDMGMSGATAVAGTGAGVGGSGTAGSGGAPVVMGGSTGTAGMAPVAGSAPMAGSGGAGGGGGGAGGGSAGSAGAGGSGGAMPGPFGVVSCQPAFETACKPDIVFENGEPNGKGKVFTNVITDVETTMKDIACVTCSMLYRTPDEIPQNKRHDTITLKLDFHGGVAQAGGGTIQFDLNYINGYANRSAEQTKREMLGVLQHETVHLYQNYGNGGTGEGMADTVRVRMGYYEQNRWSPGGSWRDAYTTSGNFYSWLTGPCVFHPEHYPMNDLDLPYKINKVLAGKSGEAAYTAVNGLLMQTFGKSADALWDQYQDTAF